MIIRGRLVYALPSPIGAPPIANAEVEVWDGDAFPSSDDLVIRTTTDDDGVFSVSFNFDPAHGYDPRPPRVWDVLAPYLKVRLAGVEAPGSYPVVAEPAVPPGSPPPTIPINWARPAVALPQDLNGADQNLRAATLAVEASLYQWKRLDEVPGAPDVRFDPPIWVLDPLTSGLPLIDDIALPPLEVNGLLNPAPGGGPSYIDERRAEGDRIRAARDGAATRDFAQPDTYRTMFGDLGEPSSVARVEADGRIPDAWFAEQRLTGLNPMKICRLGSKAYPALPDDFAPDANRIRQVTGWSWHDLIEERRLYVCDYRWLHDIAEKHPHEGRHLPAPCAVFYRTTAEPSARPSRPGLPSGSLPAHIDRLPTDPTRAVVDRDLRAIPSLPELMPLAIQTFPGGPVHVRGDGAAWEFAKLMVQVADVNEHEMAYHLWGCHIAMEPFAVAAARSLARTHPLRELFRRHFFGLLWINQYGLRHLVNVTPDDDGRAPVKDFLAPSFSGSMELLRQSRERWSIAKKALPRDLVDRGLDDPAHSLRCYPYRDDGVLLWRAIERFVGEYLDLYYDDPRDVRDDYELTAFYDELRTHDVPDVGRPDNADVGRNLAALKEHVTQILWVSSAVHNVLNAPQYPMAAYAGNLPSASNVDPAGPPPSDLRHVYVQRPNPDDNSAQRAVGMFGLTAQLSLYNPDGKAGGLGHYRFWGGWKDPRVDAIVARFRHDLDHVDADIVNANTSRPLRWEWMRPKQMSNSTST